MNIILTSLNSKLLEVFHSQEFIKKNYKKKNNGKYVFKINDLPNVNDYIYFTDTNNTIIPVRVGEIIRKYVNGQTTVVLNCFPVSVSNIDSYIFSGSQLTSNSYSYTSLFAGDVFHAYIDIYTDIYNYIETNKNHMNPDLLKCNSIRIYANFVLDKLKLEDRTILDKENLIYIICDILASIDNKFKEWHRTVTIIY